MNTDYTNTVEQYDEYAALNIPDTTHSAQDSTIQFVNEVEEEYKLEQHFNAKHD